VCYLSYLSAATISKQIKDRDEEVMMKKELLLVASAALVMGLAGCGSTTVYVTDESKTEASVAKEENDTSVEVIPPDESISEEDVSAPETEDEVYSEEDWTTDESVDGVSD